MENQANREIIFPVIKKEYYWKVETTQDHLYQRRFDLFSMKYWVYFNAILEENFK